MVDIFLSYRHWDLKTYSDAKIGQVTAEPGAPTLVDSKYWADDTSRTVMWSGQDRGTPYVLWDKFVVRESIYVDVRTAMPVSYAADTAWQTQYQAELDAMLNSLCVGATHILPDSRAPCPNVEHVLPFTRAENADGARFVWLIERRNGFPRPYVAATDFPKSTDYRLIEPDSARDGDVVWWPSLVGFYGAGAKTVLLLEGAQPLASFVQRLGPPRYYRRLVPR